MATKNVNHLHGDEFSCVCDTLEDAKEIVRMVRNIKVKDWSKGLTVTGGVVEIDWWPAFHNRKTKTR